MPVSVGVNMFKKKNSQKGQVLVLVAIGIVGLIGFTALAVDGGNFYSERRRAQNAADTSSLAGGLEITENLLVNEQNETIFLTNFNNWYIATESLISENMDNLSGVTYTYEIPFITDPEGHKLPSPGLDCKGDPVPEPYFQNSDYIQVLIHIEVDTYFARLFKFDQLNSCVEAIAYAEPPVANTILAGFGLAALNPGYLPPDYKCTNDGNEINGIKLEGGAQYVSADASLFSNSNCDPSFWSDSNQVGITAPKISAVGTIEVGNATVNSILESPVPPQPFPPDYLMPDPAEDCGPVDENRAIQEGMWLSPGNYTGNKFPPEGVTNLEPGLYCVYSGQNGFIISNQPGDSLSGFGVTIALMEGAIDWTGSDPGINLHAPAAPADCVENDPRDACNYKYNGLLIFIPESNAQAHFPGIGVTWNGDTNWNITGTVLAPWTTFKINGGNNGVSLGTQILGYDFILSGDSTISILNNDALNWKGYYPAHIELTR